MGRPGSLFFLSIVYGGRGEWIDEYPGGQFGIQGVEHGGVLSDKPQLLHQ